MYRLGPAGKSDHVFIGALAGVLTCGKESWGVSCPIIVMLRHPAELRSAILP
jgi:hypothetical protein